MLSFTDKKDSLDAMNIKRKLLYLLLSLVVLIIWGSGIYYGQFVKSYYSAVSIRLLEASITKQEILTALEYESIKGTEDIPIITAWKQMNGQRFEYPELATATDLKVIEFWGDMNQIMPIQLVNGSSLISGDETGCVIDEEAAYKLFRSRDAVGRYLTYQKKSYCIRGVIKAKQEVIIIPVSKEDNAYSNLELVYANHECSEQYAKNFIEQNNLADDYTIVEGCYYAELIQMLYRLPSWILGFFILIWIARDSWRRLHRADEETYAKRSCHIQTGLWKKSRLQVPKLIQIKGRRMIQAAIFVVGFCVAAAIIIWITKFRIVLPERWIPTRWSDFAFLVERWQEEMERMNALEYLVPVTKDILLFQALRRCATCSLIAVVAAVILVTHRKVFFTKGQEIKLCLIVIGLEGFATFCLYYMGLEFHLTSYYLYILPCFIFFSVNHVMKKVPKKESNL